MDGRLTGNQVPFVDLGVQYQTIQEEIDEAISRVLEGADFILGKEVDLFEQGFADLCEVGHAVGVDSGTSALELALRALGIGPGDEVVTVANSFIATALAISYTGARPVLVDVDPESYTMDVSRLEASITDRTRAVVPVHLYGHPADMDPILEIARRNDLFVVEDACQAHGARYKGKPVGSLGHAAAFSFYPGKNLGAYGDGGIVVTDDGRVAETIRSLRNYGQGEKYHHLLRGFNRRLDTLQAAVLRVKLRHLEEWNAARRRHAARYTGLLAASPIALPSEADYAEPVYHLYVIRTADRDGLTAHLRDNGIATGIHYPIPIHLQPAYHDLGYERGSFPVAEEYADRILSLPIYPEMTPELVVRVADAVLEHASAGGVSRQIQWQTMDGGRA